MPLRNQRDRMKLLYRISDSRNITWISLLMQCPCQELRLYRVFGFKILMNKNWKLFVCGGGGEERSSSSMTYLHDV
jgi:hypothetical protein